MHVTAIIAAGGRGERFGAGMPKQLAAVSGRPILERSLSIFLTHPEIAEIVVALPAEILARPPAYLAAASKPLKLASGGARRQDSVLNAFNIVSEQSDVIVIHDAARPFASEDLVSRTIRAAVESGAALAALPSTDTVKRAVMVRPGEPIVAETLPRESIFLAQTPQAFTRQVLRQALALADTSVEATDEAALVERMGHTVRLVTGEPSNIKITTAEDLAAAEVIARASKPARTGRAGTGYDLHRLVEGRPLILGGIWLPFDKGLAGHSDADVVCHAITDAILGAASAGDIGRHFPDTDPRWKDASSVDLLRRAVEIIGELGFGVGNVDATIIAERPKLAPYIDAMRARIAGAIGIEIDRVSLKGKTNEGVGELGRGEAIAVHAIALVRSLN
jgi:2-C-methyl-D-erythritol 4-phosphate cytidylyltransferase / 2-C-methyl-D-erythritol 2,4-cyclodiphosphate synthase